MNSTSLKKWQDQYICDWFDGLDENYIKELQAEVGVDITPKKAWLAVFGAGAKPMPNKKLPISTRVTRLSPVPAQESQGDCVAAPAEVVQGQGTPTLEQFQRWLETRAHAAHARYFNGPEGETLAQELNRCRPFTLQISECRVATSLLMQFKLEQRT